MVPPVNPTVSVVIPVYNRFELLKRAVESVLAQTLPVFEVILVDDGSVDGTSELLPRYVAENPAWRGRVHYFHQENQGPSVASNNGVARAKGEWLALLANDDLWLPQKLEWQFRALERFKGQCGVCFTDAWFMNNPHMKMSLFQLAGRQHNEPIGIVADPVKYALERGPLAGVHPVWMQTVVVRTDLVRGLGGADPELRYGDDDDMVFRLACETAFCFVSMPMVLIDRTPREERHVGEGKNWDRVDFRLRMMQRSYEKRLGMSERLPREVREAIRKDLSDIHSGWTNWFLEKREYGKARESVTEAASFHFTPRIAIKWALTRFIPGLARTAIVVREQKRRRKTYGIG